jgi:hypothetical protein
MHNFVISSLIKRPISCYCQYCSICTMRLTIFHSLIAAGFVQSQVTALSLSPSLPKSLLLSLTKEYSKCLQTQPLITNVLTASALCVFSDSVSQYYERSKEKSAVIKITTSEVSPLSVSVSVPKHSWYRSFCMSIYGAITYGWLVTYWFKFLNHLVPQQGITFPLVLKKVTINQFFMSPLLNSMFFTYVTLTRDLTSSLKEKIKQVPIKLKKDLIPTIKRSCVYWGVAQTVNFSFVTTRYQLLYTNSAFVIWTIYTSFIGFRK